MEKEKLSSELRGLVGENGLSDRTWNDYIDNSVIPFIPSEEDKVGDYLAKHAKSLKSLNGQLNYDVAGKVNEFKKTYKPDDPASPQPQPHNDEVSKKLKELDEFKKSLENRYESESKAAKINEKRNGVLTKLKEQGADDPEILEFVELKLSIEADSDVNALVTSATQLYNDKYSRVYKGEVNPASGYGNTTAAKKNTKDAYLKHLEETGRIKPKTQN